MNKISKKTLRDFLGINAGIFLVALGIVVFRNPNKFASGGVTGFALLLTAFFPGLPVGASSLFINAAILGLGYLLLGKKRSLSSVYGTFALSGMIWLMELAIPLCGPLTDQKFLELIYSVFLPGFGTALVFYFGATTGGTDIIAQILSKFFKWKLGTSLLAADFLIALGAGLLFGAEAGLYSVLGVCLRSFLLDSVLENLHIYKIVVIISDKSMAIQDYICHKLKRSATVHMARGAYTAQDKEVITTVVGRRQALKLQQFIKATDPSAFLTVTNSTEIIGLNFGKFE